MGKVDVDVTRSGDLCDDLHDHRHDVRVRTLLQPDRDTA